MSRASTQVPLTGLFLAATHGPKTRLTSQGEHALIRPWLWTLASDVGSYKYIVLVEFTYNTSHQVAIGMVSYEALYGKRCRTPLCWEEIRDRKLFGAELVQSPQRK
jgi:hypothetical protein